jgi:serine/threonine-protein phosphatase 5
MTSSTEAEDWKNKGNEFFKQHKYQEAVDCYTKAIDIQPTAVYLSNRALNHIHLENYGSALEDAEHAIKIDPSFAKAYYRRGTARLALAKIKDALEDFQKVVQLCPTDKIAKQKVTMCKQELRTIAFMKAIESEYTKLASETTDWHSIVVDASYDGMRLNIPDDCKDVDQVEIPIEWVEDMMERFKQQKKIHIK